METCWEMCWWLWLTRTSWVTCSPLGKVLLFLHGSLGNLCWFYPWKGLVCSIGKFLCNSRRGCLRVSNPRGSSSMIPYFTRDFVGDLNSQGSFLGKFWYVEGWFWCFPFIGGCFEGLHVLYPTKGISIILVHSWIFFFTSYFLVIHWGYLRFFFYY